WPTQPFPLKPGPIGRVGMTRDDISKVTPEIVTFCTDFWDSHKMQPTSAYAQAILGAPGVRFPSALGGPNWGPLSYNPQLGYVFISLHNTGTYMNGQQRAGPGAAGGGRGAGARGAAAAPGAAAADDG